MMKEYLDTKKAHILFSAIVLFAGLGILMTGERGTIALNVAQLLRNPRVVTVEMSREGFSPDLVEAQRGDVLIFRNVDVIAHWPASNFHPTHGIYPEFDPQAPIDPGKTWSFKFRKSGEWRYHDHLYPLIKGTIIIR